LWDAAASRSTFSLAPMVRILDLLFQVIPALLRRTI
jgi:hypothetical protein